MFTIVCSWLLVHTVFALRMRTCTTPSPKGGIDFKTKGAEHPDYLDFAYTAFTIGMTFQVSDTDITQRAMRHQVLRHALDLVLLRCRDPGETVNVLARLLNT